MKFLIDGFGSIGQRHTNNLLNLGYKDIIIISKKKKLNKKFSKLKIFTKLKDGLNLKPNVAIICNPTSLHDESIISCAKSDCHIFVEKPISSKIRNEKKINSLIKKKKINKHGWLYDEVSPSY